MIKLIISKHLAKHVLTKLKKTLSYLLYILLLCTLNSAAYSFDTLAKSAIVFDETTGSILLEKDADKPLPPASMSKLMTLLLAFEALQDGRVSLENKFRVSAKASQKGGSKMFIEENQLVSVEDLVRGITVASGNDACIALAEALNGTEDSFVSRMNIKAKDLGLTNSYFTNSTGWPATQHVMSARDLLKLAIHVREKYPEYYHYFQEKEFTWNGIRRQNRNPLLNAEIGADGLKTGHTEEAGYGLVGSSKLGDRRVSFVLAGLKTSQDRKFEGEKIANWAFRDFSVVNLFPNDHLVGRAPVWIGEENYVGLFTTEEIKILLPYGKKSLVKAEAHVQTPITTPIMEHDTIGTLRISAPSFILGNKDRILDFPLVSKSNIGTGSIAKKVQAAARTVILKALKLTKLNDVIN